MSVQYFVKTLFHPFSNFIIEQIHFDTKINFPLFLRKITVNSF